MADNNFKGGPGGRLKAEEKKNTLYVSNPNDPRLQAYRDSSDLYNFYKTQKSLERSSDFVPTNFIELLKTGESIKLSDEGKKRRDLVTKAAKEILTKNKNIKVGLINNPTPPIAEYDERGSYDIMHPAIRPKGTWSGTALNNDYSNVNPKRRVEYISDIPKETISEIVKAIPPVQKPQPKPVQVIKRKVYENIEPLSLRQAPVPQLAQPQIVSPVMRPVSVPQTTPMEEPMMEEQVVTERPVARKLPRAVMPTRQGGWGNQPLLMKLFPKLYER